ncbi:myosin-11-like [Patiria miniata]|uniref:Uncharacterized protein n=1 Tax=Patiria miniata TaxID=46514 RepID=A0A913ZU24_PATMI|nr:myosin-11-like [Patiria miniata]
MEPLSSISDGDQLLEQTVSGLVDSAIHAALQELRNEKVQGATCSIPTKTSSTESLALDPVTPTTDGLWSIALGLDESYNNSGQGQDDTSVFLEDNLSGISSELSLAKGMAAGCSPVMKISKPCFTPANHHEGQETRLAPTIHQDNISIDADGENSNNHMRSRRLVLGLPGSTPIASHQMIQGTDSVQKVVQKLEMTNMALVELEPLMKVVPAEIAIRSSCTVPIELPHTSHGTRPDDRANTSVAMTPVKTMQTDSMTSATNVAGVAVGSTPVHSNITAMTDSSVGVTPVKSYSIFTGTTPHKPILKTDSCLMTTPIYVSKAYNGTTPTGMTDGVTMTNPTSSTDACIGTTPIRPVEVLNKSVTATLSQLPDSAFGTASKQCSDANCGTTPVRVSNTSTVTTPTGLMDASVGTTPSESVEMTNKSVMVTPIRMSDTMTETTPIQSSHALIGTTPVKSADIGLSTDPALVTDSSTGTSPVRVTEVGVGTGSYQAVDAQCGSTPVRVVDMKCGTSPSASVDASTAVTPLALSTAETLTSPIVVPAFKLEAESPSQLDASSLMSHMESACISNELLRREIQTMKTTKAELQHQLDGAREQLERREVVERLEQLNPKVELRQTSKESLQTEVDNLLLQVGEQMNQQAFLQEALHQKSAELSTANQDKINMRDQYQKEIHNLQQDLCIAYKQQQQEVSDLHAFYEQNNYEPHYMRARVTIAELKTELQAYTDLKDTLDKAAEIQEQFGCIEEAYSLVNALFTKTMDKKDELDKQQVAMVDEMNHTKALNEQLQQLLATAKDQQHYTQTQLQDAINAEKDALKCQGQLLGELDEVSQTSDEIKSELQNTKLELSGYKSDYETVMAKMKALEQQSIEHFLAECTVEAALAIQSKQWQDTTAEMQIVHSQTGEEIQNLMLQNTRLTAETTDQKHQLSSSQDLIIALQSELERNKEIMNQQAKELESLEWEREMSKKAKADAQRMARQIQNFEQQFKENIEFLEEERVALVESAREAEDQLKVTSLELSRLKVALSKAEESGSQWKGAAETLSERLQFCQSELDNTKAHAHWMLLNQATEMRDAADGLTALLKKIQDVFTHLNISMEDQQLNKEASEPTAASKMIQSKSKSQTNELASGSLVASILSAIQSKDEDINDEDMVLQETPSVSLEQQPRTPSPSDSGFAIGGSGSSAFTAVETSTNQNICAVDMKVNKADELKESKDDSLALVEQVEQARALSGQLLKLLLARNDTLASVVKELKEERCQLHTQLLRSQKLHDRELCVIREQLLESEMQERRLHQEVANRNASLTEQQQALQYAQQRLQSMADNLERFSDQKSTIEKLQTETAKLTSSLRVAQREKGLLQEQLDNVLSGCSQSSNEDDVDGRVASQPTAVRNKLIRENLSLKKELERLRVCLVERQEHYETLNARATKHMRVLEDNWHKADAEVYRLDEVFDHCKQLMEQVPVTGDEHSSMSALRQLLS